MFAGRVDVADEFLQTFFRVENFHLGVVLFIFYTKVGQSDLDACIQIGQLAHTGSKNLVVVNGFREDRVIRPELLTCTCNIACSDFLYRIQRMSAFIFLLIDFSVTENLRSHVCGQGVHTRYTYTVQTSGYFVRSLIELTAGMQYGHDNFQGWLLLFFVKINRNTTSVILYSDGIIFVDGYFNVVAIAGECFVDRVIHNFINQVVKSFRTNVTNIHRGTLSNSFQTFQNLDVLGWIAPVIGVNLFFSHNLISLFK